uniref:IQ domain-containing protein IQM2-like n=1 Tax=Kalanchoe fedtschenkoi TaxID=63787 RepID=A0A7N0UDC0_KALFE
MGISCWCPFGKCDDLETSFSSVIAKFVSVVEEEGKTNTISINLNRHEVESATMKSGASFERSMSFKRKKFKTSEAFAPPTRNKDSNLFDLSNTREATDRDSPKSIGFGDLTPKSSLMILGSPEHEAAVKLQKVYKSFRTRRKLADCAVLVEQSWWKLLDFAELKRSSISFFEVEKHETAISKWSRARTRAAKVGKGLSQNNKAQKLALQHWLEAIDPRHRYGHNLHFYYAKWLQSQSREPFFYWLDLGEGKEINLIEKCPRSKLQQQCIKYLGPMERRAYEIQLENGKFFRKQTGEILDTTGGPKGAKWIFVLSTSRILYVGRKQKGTFQHSSFLAGGATSAAGQLVVDNGILRAVWPHSGHYRPTEENFKDFISFLKENNVDLTYVQMTPVDDEQKSYHRQNSNMEKTNNSSEEDLTQNDTNAESLTKVKMNLVNEEANGAALEFQKSRKVNGLGRKLTYLEIPTRYEFLLRLQSEDQVAASSGNSISAHASVDGYESQEEEEEEEEENEAPKKNSYGDSEEEDSQIEAIHEKIIQRVNSRKDSDSYPLGRQLSRTWTSGAGPRIGCLRDYPFELQNHALEKVSLSPRSTPSSRSDSNFTPRNRFGTVTPKPFAPLSHASSSPLSTMLFSQRSIPHSSTPPSLWKANSLGIVSSS